MLRRAVVLPLLGWIGEHTAQHRRLDRVVDCARTRAVEALTDRDIARLIEIRPPRQRWAWRPLRGGDDA